MSFGLTMAPHVFMKLLVAHLNPQGVTLFPYLNNVLITVPLREQTFQDTHSTFHYLRRYQFVINLTKNSLTPMQSLIHLGLSLDTAAFQVFLFPDRQESLTQALNQALLSQKLLRLKPWPDSWG